MDSKLYVTNDIFRALGESGRGLRLEVMRKTKLKRNKKKANKKKRLNMMAPNFFPLIFTIF